MSDTTIEMPKTWTEKLNELALNESCLVDKSSSVTMCIHRHFRNSDRKFSIRKDRTTGEVRVWRTK